MVRATVRPLTRTEQRTLRAKLRTRSLPVRLHQRYRVIAEVRRGCSLRQAADRVGVTANTASTWVRRFNASGFATFEAASNPRGRIPIITARQIQELIDVALSSPTDLGLPFTTWTVKRLSEYCQQHRLIPDFTDEWVRRLLRREGLTAQKIRTWKTSTDPLFHPNRASRGAAPRRMKMAPALAGGEARGFLVLGARSQI